MYSGTLEFYHFMSKARMTWEYYLQLKKGISSGESKLFCYHLFFTSKNPALFTFCLSYLKTQLYYNLVWIQFEIRSKLNSSRYSKESLSLGKIINRNKAKTFNRDFVISLNQFKKVKKMIGLI